MESTSCGQNCPFFKQGFCASERECPNYVETWWVSEDSSVPKMVKDCSPKRILLQQQQLQINLQQVQASLCESRNEYHRLAGYLKSLVETSQKVIQQQEKKYEAISTVDADPILIE